MAVDHEQKRDPQSGYLTTGHEWNGITELNTPVPRAVWFFVNCRCESYPGTALAITGGNTNEIFFTNCKFESGQAERPAITLESAAVIHFGPVHCKRKSHGGNESATGLFLVHYTTSRLTSTTPITCFSRFTD